MSKIKPQNLYMLKACTCTKLCADDASVCGTCWRHQHKTKIRIKLNVH